jgi:hypothetical protein
MVRVDSPLSSVEARLSGSPRYLLADSMLRVVAERTGWMVFSEGVSGGRRAVMTDFFSRRGLSSGFLGSSGFSIFSLLPL